MYQKQRSSATRWVAAVATCALTMTTAPASAAKPTPADAASEASYVAKQAIDYYKNGDPRMAADLYRRAFRIDSSKPEYLFGAARAEQKAGRAQEALLAYQTVMALMPSTDPLAKKAKAAIEELRGGEPQPAPEAPAKPVGQPEPSKPVEAPTPIAEPKPAETAKPVEAPEPVTHSLPTPAVTQPMETSSNWHRPAGWALVATGGAALIGGAILGALAASGRSSLDANKLPDGVHYDPLKISHDEVATQQTAINGKVTGAVICGIAGVVVGGAGIWALVTAPSRVAVTPGPGPLGVGLAVRF